MSGPRGGQVLDRNLLMVRLTKQLVKVLLSVISSIDLQGVMYARHR